MSRYKIKFYVSTNCVGAITEETIDLIEDYGFTIKEAKEIFENEDKISEIFNEWLGEKIDAGWTKLREKE